MARGKMGEAKIVQVNGKRYNSKTGLAEKTAVKRSGVVQKSPGPQSNVKKIVIKSKEDVPPGSKAARRTMRSQTLNRRFVKKPAPVAKHTDRKITPAKPKPRNLSGVPNIAIKPSPIIPRGQTVARPTRAAINPTPETPAEDKTSYKKPALVTLLVIILVAAAGVLTYLFVPAVSVWVAASRADVHAKLPVYAPTDYAVHGAAESSPGLVVINYKSR
ncbi:MAG: hypothetical protein LBC95_02135, partial [Candidatus Nomurabacteria bacterium]|nr:hypothetical protein [Candidatus Nomurabacteria bacterium]